MIWVESVSAPGAGKLNGIIVKVVESSVRIENEVNSRNFVEREEIGQLELQLRHG
jgi:hypothetical protein